MTAARWPAVVALFVCGSWCLPASAHARATLRAIRQITTPTTSRLIVEFSEPVNCETTRVAARPDLGIPARVYVDFPNSTALDTALRGLAFAEGPLLRVRVAKRAPTTTRLILDVLGLREFGVVAMPDPFRVIVDVHGNSRVATRLRTARAPPAPRTGGGPAPAPRARLPMAPMAKAPQPSAPVAPASPRLTIVIDAGHGGKDPGAIGVGQVPEKDVVLAIARRLKERLAAMPGVKAILTRDSDVFLRLEERTARANREHADLFVSIHANANPSGELAGVETYYLNNTNDRATLRLAEMENGLRSMIGPEEHDRGASLILSDLIQNYKIEESTALATAVQAGVVGALAAHGTPTTDLGVKKGPFYVLVGAGMPCVLVEVSFITHPDEGRRLVHGPYQDAIATGLLHGIQRFVENATTAGNL